MTRSTADRARMVEKVKAELARRRKEKPSISLRAVLEEAFGPIDEAKDEGEVPVLVVTHGVELRSEPGRLMWSGTHEAMKGLADADPKTRRLVRLAFGERSPR